jgi:hypothetical protein
MAISAEQIRHTLSAIFHEQGKTLPAELLDTARVEIEYAGEDFQRDQYTFNLRIPPLRYAKLESRLNEIQDSIQEKLGRLGIDYQGGDLSAVRIYPELALGAGAVGVAIATPSDEKRLCIPGRIRLFLSHVSKIKDEVGAVKAELHALGIDGFVAHEDIEPQQQWQKDIEIALGSMDVLCAFMTPEYVHSPWCDQEAGFALGRGVPVVTVNYGAIPHGFLAKIQAIGGDNRDPKECATKIADVIARQEHLQSRFTKALVEAVTKATSYIDAIQGMKRLSDFSQHLSAEQVKRLLEAARDNDQVSHASGVSSKINAIARERRIVLPPPPKTGREFDDDIPF